MPGITPTLAAALATGLSLCSPKALTSVLEWKGLVRKEALDKVLWGAQLLVGSSGKLQYNSQLEVEIITLAIAVCSNSLAIRSKIGGAGALWLW